MKASIFFSVFNVSLISQDRHLSFFVRELEILRNSSIDQRTFNSAEVSIPFKVQNAMRDELMAIEVSECCFPKAFETGEVFIFLKQLNFFIRDKSSKVGFLHFR